MSREQLDQLCVNTIRTLSMDAIQQAQAIPGRPWPCPRGFVKALRRMGESYNRCQLYG